MVDSELIVGIDCTLEPCMFVGQVLNIFSLASLLPVS
jgi:hypothetical protein